MAKVVRTGFFKNLFNSIIGVFIGVALVFGSIILLFFNEVRPQSADAAKSAKELTNDNANELDGQAVWIKGALSSDNLVLDTEYLISGGFIVVVRSVEMYSYVETEETRTEDNFGGGTTEITTYSYSKKWVNVSDVQDSSKFDESATHHNPVPKGKNFETTADNVKIGKYNVKNTSRIEYDVMKAYAITQSMINDGLGNVSDNYVFTGTNKGSPSSPEIGDERVSFRVVENNAEGILLASLSGDNLDVLKFQSKGVFKTSSQIYRFFGDGSIQEVISRLEAENKVLLWILRLVGFVLMVIAFSMILGPIHTISGIIPIFKKLTGALIFFASFAVSLVLSTLVIITANLLNNIFTLIALIILVIVLIVVGSKKIKQKSEKAN